ncbi:FAD-binding oxidoreductase [Tropicibacter sp. Alg240-R139]|uniref:FAD-binding oxidoreductase n=1 Tax=Tropicibacter sp. Alg240-R139 TaxID=2305991 RepID=UPI0013DF9061|nr:FAD-linked oxidase C-terminal domain-containing protein [Tropicibacter sp. Alg240-R139]
MTELTVRLFGQPEHIAAATCHFDSIQEAVQTVILTIQCGIPVARAEFLDEIQMRGVNQYDPLLNLPEKPHLFLEFHGTETSVDEDVARFREIAQDMGVHDFAFATKTEDRNRLWKVRHEAYFAARGLRPGAVPLITDCCVPLATLADCVQRARDLADQYGLLAPMAGHVGDGNFHMGVLIDPNDAAEVAAAHDLVGQLNELALELGGTITGEHGIGMGKIPYMAAQHGDAYAVMAQLKQALDPQNLFNPGKIFTVNEQVTG